MHSPRSFNWFGRPGDGGAFVPDKLPLDTGNDLLIANDAPGVGEITAKEHGKKFQRGPFLTGSTGSPLEQPASMHQGPVGVGVHKTLAAAGAGLVSHKPFPAFLLRIRMPCLRETCAAT